MRLTGMPTIHRPTLRFGTGEIEPRRRMEINVTQTTTKKKQAELTKELHGTAVAEMSKSRKSVKNFTEGALKVISSKMGHAIIATVFGAIHAAALIFGAGLPLAVTVPAHVAAHIIWGGVARAVTKGEKGEKLLHTMEHMNVPKNLEPMKNRIMTHVKNYAEKLVPEGESLEIQDGNKKITIPEVENSIAGARLMLAVLHELKEAAPNQYAAPMIQDHLRIIEKWVQLFEAMQGKERISELEDQTKLEIVRLIHDMLRSQDPIMQEAGKDIAKLGGLSDNTVKELKTNPTLPPEQLA